MNLLKQTYQEIKLTKHTPADVLWIGSDDGEYSCSWDEFAKLADENFNSYEEVGGDLVIVFSDKSWLSMTEDCNGVCGWKYNKCPCKNKNTKPVESPFNWIHFRNSDKS